MRLFETFWIAPKGPPFICFDILQHNGCQKIAKGPPFYIFGTATLFKNLIKKNFLGGFFISPKGPPLQFFFIFLQPAGVSQSPKGPPFSILSLRYDADFGRSACLNRVQIMGLYVTAGSILFSPTNLYFMRRRLEEFKERQVYRSGQVIM